MSWYSFMPKLFNMSLTAGVVICIVLILRLVLKKAPKVVSYALWIVVLFRLLCPISIESDFSLFNLLDTPTKEAGAVSSVIEYVPENIVHTEYPAVTLPIPGISDVINDALPQGQEQLAADPLEAPTSIVTYIWMIGVLVMVIYSTVSYIRLHQNLLSSVKLQDNIFLADSISSPFVIGLIRPKIYLPSSLSEKEREYIILHERHHIRRGDHIIKLLSFAALCLHWFNPLVWLAFILSGKDMEMSCDEAVLRKLGGDIRADYSASLISLATGRRIIAGAPLAFGEGDTEGRVKNIAKWKKPAVWVIVIAVIVCTVIGVCLITNPMNRDNPSGDLPGIENSTWHFTHIQTYDGSVSFVHEKMLSFYPEATLAEVSLEMEDSAEVYRLSLRNTESNDTESGVYKFSLAEKTPERICYIVYDVGMDNEVGKAEITRDAMQRIVLRITLAINTFCFTAEEIQIDPMTPTTANITGAFDGYLYVPIDGETYRYEIIFDDPASVTCGKLMYQFTEESEPNDVEWRVYAVDDYPDRSVVLAEAGDDYVYLYRYSPPKAVDPESLIAAKVSGMITLEDGYATYEQKLWTSFYLRTQDGESASVKIAHYHTLENGNYSGKYLEAYKEDYPSLSTYDLAYDGKTYTLKWNDNGTQYERQFKYLRKFEVVLPSYQSSKKPETVTRYVLTNNSTASWDELWMSLASSQLGDYIDHCTIYSEKN